MICQIRNPIALGVLALLTTAGPLAAQARSVEFRTLCLARVDDIATVVIPGDGTDASQKVELYTDVSPVVKGTFTTPNAQFFIEKGIGTDGKPVRVLVGQAPLGKSDRQLILFYPGAKGAGKPPYAVRCFDDDTKAFPLGQIRAINLAPVPIRFNLSGATTPQIPPAKYAVFSHPTKVNDYNMYPAVTEFLSGSGEWVKAQSVSWKASDRRRVIVITTVDARFKQPSVRLFAESPPWLNAAPATTP
jgi:hypothetical protein